MEPMVFDLDIHIATVGNTIQTVNSLMKDTCMSTPGNTVKLGAMHSNIQIAQTVPGWDQTYNALVSTPLSKHSKPTMPARHKTTDFRHGELF